MANIAYYRVSTADQSIESQRHQLGNTVFDKEFDDAGVSGAIVAAKRSGFGAMLSYMREGDTVFVTAIDRLGRDSIDIQTTFRDYFKAKSVNLYVAGLGMIQGEMGEFFLTLLAQMAQMGRNRITARCQAGRATARDSLARTGKTHKGKSSLGRPSATDGAAVIAWRKANNASITETAAHFNISPSSVTRFARVIGTESVA